MEQIYAKSNKVERLQKIYGYIDYDDRLKKFSQKAVWDKSKFGNYLQITRETKISRGSKKFEAKVEEQKQTTG